MYHGKIAYTSNGAGVYAENTGHSNKKKNAFNFFRLTVTDAVQECQWHPTSSQRGVAADYFLL